MTDRNPRRAAGGVARWFAASTAASIGLAVAYALDANAQVQGVLAAVALGALAAGFVRWSERLMPPGPYVEERHPLAAPADEDRAADRALTREGLPRRRFLGRMLGAALAALGVALLFPVRSLGPSPGRSLFRTAWRPGMRLVTPEGQPVAAETLQFGGVLTVFPEGRTDAADSQAILVRVDPAAITPVAGREAWAPDGNVAYSKICTHAGCPVGLYEDRTGQLFCPCHQSVFDALDGARPLAGPATRALPQLPLEVDDEGYLRSGGDFSEPVGPATWDVP
jgi:ubiquinol-cytochrome c reductase iron-sulfur subunit